MTNSELFKTAHATARNTVRFVGNYMIAFSLALKEAYKMAQKTLAQKLIELGGKEWKKGSFHRVYIESLVAVKCFDDQHASFGKAHTVYFNVETQEFFCSNRRVANNLNAMI